MADFLEVVKCCQAQAAHSSIGSSIEQHRIDTSDRTTTRGDNEDDLYADKCQEVVLVTDTEDDHFE